MGDYKAGSLAFAKDPGDGKRRGGIAAETKGDRLLPKLLPDSIALRKTGPHDDPPRN